MSTQAPVKFALGCALGVALGSGITLFALRTDRAQSSTLAAAPSDPRAPSPEQIGPRVTEILSGEDPLRRVAELSALLPTLGPTAVPALVDAFGKAPLDSGDPELELLGMWWARFDPQGAVEWTLSERRAQSDTVTRTVFRSWAQRDPKVAFAAARGQFQAHHREAASDAAVVGWDESGQPGLLEAITQLPDADAQPLAATIARRRVVTLGPAGAFRWVESLGTTPRLQQLMAERVASTAAESREGGPIAAAWATPWVRSDDRISNFPRRIATRWVVHDPEAAMAWLATLPAGADRNDGVGEAFGEWMRNDQKSAAAWIEGIERETWNEPALSFYARAIGRERPKEAVELAQRISDQSLRESTLVVIGRRWMRNDRAAAAAWLAQPGVPERVRRLSGMVAEGAIQPASAGRPEPNRMTGAVPD